MNHSQQESRRIGSQIILNKNQEGFGVLDLTQNKERHHFLWLFTMLMRTSKKLQKRIRDLNEQIQMHVQRNKHLGLRPQTASVASTPDAMHRPSPCCRMLPHPTHTCRAMVAYLRHRNQHCCHPLPPGLTLLRPTTDGP